MAKIDITARLNAASVDGILASANQIYDENKGKFQTEVNEDLDKRLKEQDGRLERYHDDLVDEVNREVADTIETTQETIDQLKEASEWLKNDPSGAQAIMEQTNQNTANIATIGRNTGLGEYSQFSTGMGYAAGAVVLYDGVLFRFKVEHTAGAWDYNEVEEWSEKKEREEKLAELGSEEGVYYSIKSKDFINKGKFYPKPSIGETFYGATANSDAWCCQSFFIPAETKFRLNDISYGEDTAGIVTDTNGIVTELIDFENVHTLEKKINYNCFLYLTTRIDNNNSAFQIDSLQHIDRINKTINFVDFQYKGYVFASTDTTIGDAIFDGSSNNIRKLLPYPNYATLLLYLPLGSKVEFTEFRIAPDHPHVTIADTDGFVIKKEEITNSLYYSFTAEQNCYIVFTSHVQASVYATNYNSITSIKEIMDKQLPQTYISGIVKAEDFPIRNSFFKDSIAEIGEVFDFKKMGASESWNSIILDLAAGETVKFCNLSYAPVSNMIYILDSKTYEVVDIINKQDKDFLSASYTAEVDVLVAFSDRTGYIVINSVPRMAVKNFLNIKNIIDSYPNEISLGQEHFIDLKKNVFSGYYINTEGKAASMSSWNVTPFIKIGNATTLSFFKTLGSIAINPTLGVPIAFYDKDFNFISGMTSEYLNSRILGYKLTIEVPENAIYFRCSLHNAVKDFKQFTEGETSDSLFKYQIFFDWKSDFYLNKRGQAVSMPGSKWHISNFIRLDKYSKYYLLGGMSGGGAEPANIAFYSENNEDGFISAITSNEAKVASYDMVLDVPEGAKYLRFCTELSTNTVELFTNYVFSETREDLTNDSIGIVSPKYLDCPIGRQTDIFIDGIIAEPDNYNKYPLRITGGDSTIYQIGVNQLRYTPTEESEKTIRFIKYIDSTLSDVNNSRDLILRAIPITVGGKTEVNVCICGDSLIDGTYAPCEAFRLLNEDGDFVVNQIGTRTATMNGIQYKHEGRGSWAWETYINPDYETEKFSDKTNAFMIDGELNFQKYMQNNFSSLNKKEIDYFVIALGTNDVTQGYSIPSTQRINTIISAAKSFIDALLSEDKGFPNCKVAIGLPGVGAPSFVKTTSSAVVFKMAIQKLNQAYISTFDNGNYHPNVTCVMHGAYIDRYNSYQHEDVAISDYIDTKVRRFTNEVHPLQVGYKQWGRGYYGKIRAFLNGNL